MKLALADLKGHRGLRRLHGRRLARAQAEIGLLVLAYNLHRWHRLRETAQNPDADAT